MLGVGVIGALAYLGTVGYIHNFDQNQTQKLLATSKFSERDRVAVTQLFANGCQNCHSKGGELPFYAQLPIVGSMVDKDIELGNKFFDFQQFLEGLNDPIKLSEAELAKLEAVIKDGSMPPARYKFIHWQSGIDATQQAQLLEWISELRKQFLPKHVETDPKNSIQPIPDEIEVNIEKVALGNILYHDVRLSGDNTISCHSCHQLNRGGVDGLKTSTGIGGQKGGINAPTVFNAVFNKTQFWDGRAKDLTEQAGGPPLNPIEMGSKNWDEVIAKLNQDETFKQQFLAVYPAITAENITDAIAEFEKTLITPNSPFDRYLKGDKSALSEQAQRGYKLFTEYRCNTCHVGTAMGGQSYERFGLYDDYFAHRQTLETDADKGRMAQTKDPKDLHKFKVPTLRNVALTAPYFHDASTADLSEAIKIMARYQSGKDLTPQQLADLKAFLESLTGEYQGKPLTLDKAEAME